MDILLFETVISYFMLFYGISLCLSIYKYFLHKKAEQTAQLLNTISLKKICLILGKSAIIGLCFFFEKQFGLSNSAVIIFIVTYFAYQVICNPYIQSRHYITKCLALIFSFMNVLGTYMTLDLVVKERFNNRSVFLLVVYFVCTIAFYTIFVDIIGCLFALTDKIQAHINVSVTKKADKKSIAIVYLLILACWLPTYLKYYPGLITSDTLWQLQQVVGLEPYSDWHPWLHTLLIKLCYELGTLIGGSPTTGLACFTFVSMLLMCAIFTYAILYVYKKGCPKALTVFVFAYYALLPFHALEIMDFWKDTLFGGAMLFFTIALYDFCGKRTYETKWKAILFIISGVLFCLLRNNGWYAFLLLTPFLIFCLYPKLKREILFSVAAIILIVCTFKGPIKEINHVKDTDILESLSIPMQQIGYTVAMGGPGILNEQQYTLLSQIADVEVLPQMYVSYCCDTLKNYLREVGNTSYIENNKADFLRLWLELGLKNPYAYVKGWIEETKGYWYHKEIFHTLARDTLENNIGIEHINLAPSFLSRMVDKQLDLFEKWHDTFWSLAMDTWVMFLCMGYMLYRKKNILAYLPGIAIFLTLLIATPVYAEFRYYYGVIVCLPLYIAFIFLNDKKTN